MNNTFKKYSWLLISLLNTISFTYVIERRSQIFSEIASNGTSVNTFDLQMFMVMFIIWFFVLYTFLVAVRFMTNSEEFKRVFTMVYLTVTIAITLYLMITLSSYEESIRSLRDIYLQNR